MASDEEKCMSACKCAVAALLNSARARAIMEGAPLELEIRLGRFGVDGFFPDLGKDVFQNVLQLLESYPHWQSVVPWTETMDVFYQVRVKDRATPLTIRTSAGGGSGASLEVTHCAKERVGIVDMRLAGSETFGARAAAAVERPVRPEEVPVAVRPHLVRIKARKRFLLASRGVERDAFAIDMTVVYDGKSKSEAEAKQRAGDGAGASYELEVECLDVEGYLESCNGDASVLALSLIAKALDFPRALEPGRSLYYMPR